MAPSKQQLKARFMKERGFTSAEVDRLGSVVTAKECGLHPAADAFKITYPGSDLFRLRYFERQPLGGKLLRYMQPKNMAPEPYYCPLAPNWTDVFSNAEMPLLITEGELKAATAVKNGLPCIALGGVFNFQSARLGLEWLPSLDKVQWEGRKVYIAYDSDAADNPMVRLAETRLALQLMKRGAEVYVIRLLGDARGKVGLDDFLNTHGKDALMKLLSEAKPWNKHEHFHKLNAEVVYVEQPNSVVRLRDFFVMGTQPFRTDHYSDLPPYINDKGKPGDTAREWMKWPGRSKVNGITFQPGRELFIDDPQNGRLLNTWRGWPVEPVEGNVMPFLRLVNRTFRGALREHKKWFLRWCAYPVQHPGTKMNSAVVIWGAEQGTGKTLLGKYIKSLYGESGHLITQQQLDSDFNGWIKCKAFVVGDEVITKESRRSVADQMKSWITDDLVIINQKFVEQYTLPNRANFYFTSNHADAFFIEDCDRRYFIHEVESPAMTPKEGAYFGEWIKQPRNVAALLYYLMHKVDCTGFDPSERPPDTEAKRDMVEAGRTELEAWVRLLPDDAPIHEGSLIKQVGVWHTAEDLCAMKQGDGKGYSTTSMGLALKKAGFAKWHGGNQTKIAGLVRRFWVVRPSVIAELGPKQQAVFFAAYRAGRASRKF